MGLHSPGGFSAGAVVGFAGSPLPFGASHGYGVGSPLHRVADKGLKLNGKVFAIPKHAKRKASLYVNMGPFNKAVGTKPPSFYLPSVKVLALHVQIKKTKPADFLGRQMGRRAYAYVLDALQNLVKGLRGFTCVTPTFPIVSALCDQLRGTMIVSASHIAESTLQKCFPSIASLLVGNTVQSSATRLWNT